MHSAHACAPAERSAHAQGILIKGGDVLERGAAVSVVIFDKTGTLTYGRPIVVGVKRLRPPSAPRLSDAELAAAVGSVESHCDHPLARALLHWADVVMQRAPESTAPPLEGEHGREVPLDVVQVRMHACLHCSSRYAPHVAC
jgi:cation transport ATPase